MLIINLIRIRKSKKIYFENYENMKFPHKNEMRNLNKAPRKMEREERESK